MSVLTTAWADLGEDPGALTLIHPVEIPLGALLPVGPLVHDAIAVASLTAALLQARRNGSAVGRVQLEPARVATAVTSERHLLVDGAPPPVWAELSGLWPTADGWVRTHANYPHHRAHLLRALDLPESTTAEDLRRHVEKRDAEDVERVVTQNGGIASVVRREGNVVLPSGPLVSLSKLGAAQRVPLGACQLPAAGVRVLDLTRVIAGPVATRTLALWGADVLRVDSPRHPELGWQHLDTGTGKRSTLIDFETQREVLDALIDTADVVVTGYRPGAFDRFGLAPAALAARRPGIVVARLSAWGQHAPRRGFDSIVQAASGISWLESVDGSTPGALPAQALDHSAGYLVAAGIMSALRRRADEGGSWLVETSLARVAAELLAGERGARTRHPGFDASTVVRGRVTAAAAAPQFDGGPQDWARAAVEWGSSAPEWEPRE